MKRLILVGLLLVNGLDSSAGDVPAKQQAIREFDVATLSRLGREIYQHDQLAWVATDVLMAGVKKEDLVAEKVGGWVVDVSLPAKPLVRFLRQHDGRVEAAYDVYFARGEKPKLSVPSSRELTEGQKAGAAASAAAQRALFDGTHPWCGGNPNTVVLDDPDGSGYLVYFLRAKPSQSAIPVGGHYRISVSGDGLTVEQIDQLFASCLTLDSKDLPKDAKPEALIMSHIVSATPLETHVFLSLQEKTPFYVTTGADQAWYVSGGEITPPDKKSDQAPVSGKKAKRTKK